MSYTIKNLAEIKTNMLFNIITNVSEINDANIGSILDMFITSISQEIAEQYEDLDKIYSGSRISTAKGEDLEELGLLVGVKRNEGRKSQGIATFIRNSPSSSDFGIQIGSVIGTQPIPGVFQYQFTTKENKTFKAIIENEQQLFINGVYEYKANERFINSITKIEGKVSSADTTFENGLDYTFNKNYNNILEETNGLILIDDCSNINNWIASDYAANPTLNVLDYYEGSSALNLIKSSTSGNIMTYDIEFTSVNLINKVLALRFYIKDLTALNKIQNVILTETDSNINLNNYKKTYKKTDLNVGWNLLYIDIKDTLIELSNIVDLSNIIKFRIQIITIENGSTFVARDIVIDFLHSSNLYKYIGDVVVFNKNETIPDNDTEISLTYIPLSLDIEVEALEIGSKYNVGTNQLIYKISNIPQIDKINNYEVFYGGLNIETDDELKDKIQNASSVANVATLNALEYNLRSLPFISAVSLIEKPRLVATEEVFIYANGIDNYALRQKVAANDDTLKIGDTSTGDDYIRNTDFLLLQNTNEIKWISPPNDGNLFYVNYEYNRLGYTLAFVVGRVGELTQIQIDEAQNLVNEKKAAGTIVEILQPNYINLNLDISITILNGYNPNIVENTVINSIREYFETLTVNIDVLVSEIIYYIMRIEGVKNCSINDIGGLGPNDYIVGIDEVARAGDIVIN